MKVQASLVIPVTLIAGSVAAEPFSVPYRCQRLVSCLSELVKKPMENTLFVFDGSESISDEDICEGILEIWGGETGYDTVCQLTDQLSVHRRQLQSSAIDSSANDSRRSLQIDTDICPVGCEDCPYTPFDPAYPSGEAYFTATTPVELSLPVDRSDRSDTQIYGGAVGALAAAKLAQAAADVCTATPPVSAVCQSTKIASDIAISVLESAILLIDYHDAAVDFAEIEAGFENTQTIIQQNCAMQADFDEDALELYIEPVYRGYCEESFLVLSNERGHEVPIDLTVDCFDVYKLEYEDLTDIFQTTEVSDGTVFIEAPCLKSSKSKGSKSESSDSESVKSIKESKSEKSRRLRGKKTKKDKKNCKSDIYRFTVTSQEPQANGVRGKQTVLMNFS